MLCRRAKLFKQPILHISKSFLSNKSRVKRPFAMANTDECSTIKEGKAEIYLPKSVFYNPVQEFNRDVTINVISEFINMTREEEKEKLMKKCSKQNNGDDSGKSVSEKSVDGISDQELIPGVRCEDGITILEGLAATGLRSMRFGKEIPGVKQIIANDLDPDAVEFIKKNSAHNNLDHLISASCDDASMLMYKHRKHADMFDVIDLDPYGTASPFLDATVQAVKPGGLLCITCTDLAILTGSNAPETCHAKYGTMPVKAKFCHELALRILLQSIESHANRYSRYIVPLISISVDFYIRVFVRVYHGAQQVKHSAAKLGNIYNCPGCGAFHMQRICNILPTKGGNHKFTLPNLPDFGDRCSECNTRYHMGGPVWAERLHDGEFVDRVIKRVQKNKDEFGTAARIEGMLTMICEELPDVPMYYVQDAICKVIHCAPPNMKEMRSAILNAGFQVSSSHAALNSLKTTATPSAIWDILRCWEKKKPISESRKGPGSLAEVILGKESQIEASFEIHPDADPTSRKKGLLRWQAKPERNWGPKPRASKGNNDSIDERIKKGAMKYREKRKAEPQRDLKQYPCKKLKEGTCDLGDDCHYSHDLVQKSQ